MCVCVCVCVCVCFQEVKRRILRLISGWVSAMLDFVENPANAKNVGSGGTMTPPLSPDPGSRNMCPWQRYMGSFNMPAGCTELMTSGEVKRRRVEMYRNRYIVHVYRSDYFYS